MKTKVMLCLTIAILFSCLTVTVLSTNVNAQQKMQPYIPLMSVLFQEDPYRQHGLQIWSETFVMDYNYHQLLTVPSGKGLIITDVVVPTQKNVFLSTTSDDSGLRLVTPSPDSAYGATFKFNSGIVFYENEIVYGRYSPSSGSGLKATFSGYFVDL